MAPYLGRFKEETPKLEWLVEPDGQDREMALLEPFWYRDPSGELWVAHAGTVINGTSIPQALWSILGSPYVGEHRRAAIVHDAVYREEHLSIDRRNRSDEMFYWACCCAGLP